MATGGGPASGPTEKKREALTCSLCLEIFTHPKLLPCSHTYCLKCLGDLTSNRQSGSFSCPQCRQQVTIPSGGVTKFQNNFYLDSEDLERARDGLMCLTHHREEVDLFCEDCKLAVCHKCVLTKHKQHNTKDLSEAATEAKAELGKIQVRFLTAVSYMINEVTAEKKELKDVQEKKAALQTAIEKKHATLVAMVNKFRDDSLASLDTVSGQIESQVSKELRSKQDNLDQLRQLHQQTQQAISSGTCSKLIAVAKEMREGRGSQQAVSNLTSPKRKTVCRPILNIKTTQEDITENVKAFYGTDDKLEMRLVAPEVKTVDRFRCGNEQDVEVFSLCPLDDGKRTWISYTWNGLNNDAPCEEFDENGKFLLKSSKSSGRVSWKNRGSGKCFLDKQSQSLRRTHSKLQRGTTLKLVNKLEGNAHVREVKVTTEIPFKTAETSEFSIKVGPHRSFDVDSSEQLFVVVEEAQAPSTQRKVHLYRRDQDTPVSTYSPPTATCQPSDVCFYKLGGREVLIVSDEGTDSLHVVETEGGELRFNRYLDPGCTLLVQPTALNTDTTGRLWVACRGGAILTMTPIA